MENQREAAIIEVDESLLKGKDNNNKYNNMLLDMIIFFNTMNALLGISTFTIPWGFQQSGIFGGCLVVVFIAFAAFETSRIVLVAQNKIFIRTGEVYSYPEIANEYLGEPWGSIVKISTVLSCLGGCVGSLIFIGGLLSQLLHAHFDTSLLMLLIPLILLSWIRSFRELTILTIFGCVAIFASVITLLIDGHMQFSLIPEKMHQHIPLFLPISALEFVGPVTYLFTIHYIVLSMGKEILLEHSKNNIVNSNNVEYSLAEQSIVGEEQKIERNSARKLVFPLALSFIVSGFLLAFLGILGLLWYRDAKIVTDHSGKVLPGCEQGICQNIVLNLTAGTLRNVVATCLIISISFSFIILINPAREHVEKTILRYLPSPNRSAVVIYENIIRTFLVCFTVFIAIKYPYFGEVLGSAGGLTDALQSFVVPPLIYLQMYKDKLDVQRSIFYRALALSGLQIMLYTLWKFLVSFLNLDAVILFALEQSQQQPQKGGLKSFKKIN